MCEWGLPVQICFGVKTNLCLPLQLNIWRYGDFRADDADEFGYRR